MGPLPTVVCGPPFARRSSCRLCLWPIRKQQHWCEKNKPISPYCSRDEDRIERNRRLPKVVLHWYAQLSLNDDFLVGMIVASHTYGLWMESHTYVGSGQGISGSLVLDKPGQMFKFLIRGSIGPIGSRFFFFFVIHEMTLELVCTFVFKIINRYSIYVIKSKTSSIFFFF